MSKACLLIAEWPSGPVHPIIIGGVEYDTSSIKIITPRNINKPRTNKLILFGIKLRFLKSPRGSFLIWFLFLWSGCSVKWKKKNAKDFKVKTNSR